jgi:ABC-type nitrate/sulfonate/bicarbonate transport system ATPase subunit
MRDAGGAVLVVSSELDEILALADRVLVMNRAASPASCRSPTARAGAGAADGGQKPQPALQMTRAEGLR